MNLSPSLAHAPILKKLRPQLAYTSGPFKPWQKKVRTKMDELLGVPHLKKLPPLKSQTLWKRDTPDGTIEKISFTAEPGSDVVAYWCVPHQVKKPYPTFICLQGHSTGMHRSINVDYTERKFEQSVGDRDYAIGAMKRGIAALCIEQRSFGLRRERVQKYTSPHGYCQDAVVRTLMIGRTLTGERVFDVDRGIDWLEQYADVDLKRLGVMGNSGGGVTSMYAGALLDRITHVMPSCCFGKFADSIATKHHCVCNIVPGIMLWMDTGDICGASAPKPMVIVSGKTDWMFPFDSAAKEFKQVKKIYTAAGAADKCKFIEGGSGHRFYAKPAWDAMLAMM